MAIERVPFYGEDAEKLAQQELERRIAEGTVAAWQFVNSTVLMTQRSLIRRRVIRRFLTRKVTLVIERMAPV